jgi:hypothetical protein
MDAFHVGVPSIVLNAYAALARAARLRGSSLISVPACCSASRSSYKACRFIQNCGLVPNLWTKRSTVSPVIARFSVDNLTDAIRRHAQLPRQFSGAYSELLEFIGQNLAGMDSCTCHVGLPAKPLPARIERHAEWPGTHWQRGGLGPTTIRA